MRLYRYEVEQLIGDRYGNAGDYQTKEGIFFSNICYHVFENEQDDRYQNDIFDYYTSICNVLHTPDADDFIEGNVPNTALFYFTEKGYDLVKDFFKRVSILCKEDKIRNNKDCCKIIKSAKVNLININLKNINQYKCWYQDELQICIEIVK